MTNKKIARSLLPSVTERANSGWFTQFIAKKRQSGILVVQPRMGFGSMHLMRQGLQAVKNATATTIGTLTLDSYTRVNNYDAAYQALQKGHELNGFPLVTYGPQATGQMLSGIQTEDFPIQVRHGSALPLHIFKTLLQTGLDASEGGPVSYCLPYSRVPLQQAVKEWATCCQLMADERANGKINHLESFGGCMLGQLCPPSLLIALSILEGIFFRYHGLASISLSYAQQTSMQQDKEAVMALRRLARTYLWDIDWHVVIYTYMGVYPRTFAGATALLRASVELAVSTGSERLIVKTPVEASRIPTIEENVYALQVAAQCASIDSDLPQHQLRSEETVEQDSECYREALALIEAVLSLHADPGQGLLRAFASGVLDIPYCLHPDNRNKARSFIDDHNCLRWANPGAMPLPKSGPQAHHEQVTALGLLTMLSHNERRFDALAEMQQLEAPIFSN